MLAAEGNIVGHAEQFFHHILTDEHAEGYGYAQSAEQNPSHPSEMVESEGKEYSYKENGNKRTLQSFFYNGCLHTRCKITDYFRHFVTFSYFLYKKQRLSGY